MKDIKQQTPEKTIQTQETSQEPPPDSRFYRSVKGKPVRIQFMTNKSITVVIREWDKYTITGSTKEGAPVLIYKHAVMFIYPADQAPESE